MSAERQMDMNITDVDGSATETEKEATVCYLPSNSVNDNTIDPVDALKASLPEHSIGLLKAISELSNIIREENGDSFEVRKWPGVLKGPRGANSFSGPHIAAYSKSHGLLAPCGSFNNKSSEALAVLITTVLANSQLLDDLLDTLLAGRD